jgi:cytosine deaminase
MISLRDFPVPQAQPYWIRRARIPVCFLPDTFRAGAPKDDGVLVDLLIDRASIAAIERAGAGVASPLPTLDLEGRQVWPTLVDMHAHLDKGHVVTRTENPDGSFAGAREATTNERTRYWTETDIRKRMNFALRCAYVHGVAAIRTHLDSQEPDLAQRSWSVFRETREEWRGRIALQAVALVPIDAFRTPYGEQLANLVAESGGVLGGVTRASGGVHSGLLDDIDPLLDSVLRLAAERNLDVDLHVDESGDPEAAALERVAAAVLRNRFKGRIVCGHCCSLSVQSEDDRRRTIDLCAEAGVSVVTLPTVNLYLQDRNHGRTPRWRGVAPIQEMRRSGIPVAIGGDNCRDPFHAYGDHDMVDTFRQAVRIMHLDHPFGDVPALAGPVPAEIIDVAPLGALRVGAPARLILFSARTINELMCRPQADRLVIDRGKPVDDALPDYAELDQI